jgi:hypothetical protein
MRELTLQEHTTALVVIALYYWFNDDTYNANNALEVAVRVSESSCNRIA